MHSSVHIVFSKSTLHSLKWHRLTPEFHYQRLTLVPSRSCLRWHHLAADAPDAGSTRDCSDAAVCSGRCGATDHSFIRAVRPHHPRATSARTWQRGAEENEGNRQTHGETKVSDSYWTVFSTLCISFGD